MDEDKEFAHQKLVEEIMQTLHRQYGEPDYISDFIRTAQHILTCFTDPSSVTYAIRTIMDPIRKHTADKVEREYILSMVLGKVVASILANKQYLYLKQEIHDDIVG